MRASYRGISYEIEQLDSGMWQWSFQPSAGARQAGRVRGGARWAHTVARRAIDIWHLMNRSSQAA
jgi:hypothetical protein